MFEDLGLTPGIVDTSQLCGFVDRVRRSYRQNPCTARRQQRCLGLCDARAFCLLSARHSQTITSSMPWTLHKCCSCCCGRRSVFSKASRCGGPRVLLAVLRAECARSRLINLRRSWRPSVMTSTTRVRACLITSARTQFGLKRRG
jgi:hypothetical protein